MSFKEKIEKLSVFKRINYLEDTIKQFAVTFTDTIKLIIIHSEKIMKIMKDLDDIKILLTLQDKRLTEIEYALNLKYGKIDKDKMN